jgi:hypothetical protein
MFFTEISGIKFGNEVLFVGTRNVFLFPTLTWKLVLEISTTVNWTLTYGLSKTHYNYYKDLLSVLCKCVWGGGGCNLLAALSMMLAAAAGRGCIK